MRQEHLPKLFSLFSEKTIFSELPERQEGVAMHIEKTTAITPWPVWLVLPCTRGWQVPFPIQAHTQVSGSIPGQGVFGRQPSMFLSLSHVFFLSPFYSLKSIRINK